MKAVVRHAFATGAVLVLAVLMETPFAGAQGRRPPKPPATEAFAVCREQEKVGDATACWKVWLSKWREVGGDAESTPADRRTG